MQRAEGTKKEKVKEICFFNGNKIDATLARKDNEVELRTHNKSFQRSDQGALYPSCFDLEKI